jgi:PAS domain S-box-containing protein
MKPIIREPATKKVRGEIGTKPYVRGLKGATSVQSLGQALLDAASDASVVINAEGKIILANTQTEKLFGYWRQELLNEPAEILLPHRFRGKRPGHPAGFLGDPRGRAGKAGMELFGSRKDGTEFPIEITLGMLETDDGVLVSSVIRDTSERKQAQSGVPNNEEQFRMLVNGVTDYAIFMLDLAGHVVSWNAGAERIKGYSAEEIPRLDVQRSGPHVRQPLP